MPTPRKPRPRTVTEKRWAIIGPGRYLLLGSEKESRKDLLALTTPSLPSFPQDVIRVTLTYTLPARTR